MEKKITEAFQIKNDVDICFCIFDNDKEAHLSLQFANNVSVSSRIYNMYTFSKAI